MMDLPVLIKRCNMTSRKLLGHYVELHGQRISQLVRQSVEAPNWLAVSSGVVLAACIVHHYYCFFCYCCCCFCCCRVL